MSGRKQGRDGYFSAIRQAGPGRKPYGDSVGKISYWQNTGQLAPVMRGHSGFHWWTAGGTRPCLGPVRDMTLHLLQYLWSRLRHDTSLAVVLWSSHRHDISWSSHRHDTSLAAVPLVQSETRHFTCCSTSGPVTDTTLTCCNTSGLVTNTTFHLL